MKVILFLLFLSLAYCAYEVECPDRNDPLFVYGGTIIEINNELIEPSAEYARYFKSFRLNGKIIYAKIPPSTTDAEKYVSRFNLRMDILDDAFQDFMHGSGTRSMGGPIGEYKQELNGSTRTIGFIDFCCEHDDEVGFFGFKYLEGTATAVLKDSYAASYLKDENIGYEIDEAIIITITEAWKKEIEEHKY